MPATQRGGPDLPPGPVTTAQEGDTTAAAPPDSAGNGTHPRAAAGGETRRTFLIDREYQFREINRAVTVFVVLIGLQVALFIGVAQAMRRGILNEVSGPTVFVGIAFAVPMLLCLVYCWIILRQSHHVAGAAYRLRQDLPNLVGDPGFRFRLRKGDYLQALVSELNKVMERIEARQASVIQAREALDALREELADTRAYLPPGRIQAIDAYLEEVEHAMAASMLGNGQRPTPGTPGSPPPGA